MATNSVASALLDVQQGLSIAKAAVKHQVPYNQLYRCVQDQDEELLVMPPNGALLYSHEEEDLKNYIIKCAENAFPRTAYDIRYAAAKIVAAFPRPTKTQLENGLPGRGFVQKYMKRHPDLSFRKSSHISTAGAMVTERSISAWFSWLKGFLVKHGLWDFYTTHPQNIFNADESPLPANAKPPRAAGCVNARRRYKVAHPNSKEQFTMMGCGNAAGWMMKPYIILKGHRVSDELAASVPENVSFTLEKEGYQTQGTFLGNRLFSYTPVWNRSHIA